MSWWYRLKKRYPELCYLSSYGQNSLFLPLLSGTRTYFFQDSLISSCFDVSWGGQFEQQISFTNLISVSQAHLIMLLKAEQNHWVGKVTGIKVTSVLKTFGPCQYLWEDSFDFFFYFVCKKEKIKQRNTYKIH